MNALTKNTCDCSDINVAEILLMFMHISKKHSLRWSALLDIFMILNFIFKKSIFPTTTYMLKKLMNVDTDCFMHHVLCSKCGYYLGKKSSIKSPITCICGSIQTPSTTDKFFIEIDIFPQLQKLFSDNTIISSLEERFVRQKQNNEALEDLYDGKMYKSYCKNKFLKNKWNFSYTFNTDGCQASDNSKVSIWPIFMMLHEIPNSLRKKYMILAGLWVAKAEPSMNIFLRPFVEQANRLSTEGFKWMNNGVMITSKLFPVSCCVDSVARCGMLNMKKFNGIYGCTFCEHATENIDGVRKYPMLENVPRKRTDQSIREQMVAAHFNNNKDITGVWGPSALINLKHFNLVNGMIVDFMHSGLLGVSNLYTDIIMSNAHEEYYVGSPAAIHIINKRLLSNKPPTCIGKLPRSIEERNMWKASEWLYWILFYALPCLHGLLPRKNLNHLALFVSAMTILLSDSITKDMLQRARKLLIKFVLNFGRLYGDQYMHYNVHLLLHMCDTVHNWGPLWAISTFPFENENKELLKLKKNNNEIAVEIATRLLTYQKIPYLENESFVSDSTTKFCKEIYFQRSKKVYRTEDCNLLGVGKYHDLNQEETEALEPFLMINEISECKKFERMIYKSFRYTTSSYSKTKKNNDSVFETTNNKFGIIHGIYLIKQADQEEIYIFFKLLKLEPITFVNDIDVSDVINYKICTLDENNLQCMRYSLLYRPSIITQSRGKYFLSKIVKGAMGRNIN